MKEIYESEFIDKIFEEYESTICKEKFIKAFSPLDKSILNILDNDLKKQG